MGNKFYLNVNKRGNNILLREWDVDENREIRRTIKYKPTMFVQTKEESEYHDIHGVKVKPIKFNTMKESDNFIEKYDDVDGFNIYGNDNYIAQFIAEEYPNIKYDQTKNRIFNLDIEVHSAVQMYEDEDGKHTEFKIRKSGNVKKISRENLLSLIPKLDKTKPSGVDIETHNGFEPIEYFRFTMDDAFPKPEVAKWPISLIGLKDSFDGKYHIWGFGNEDWDPINPCKTYTKELHRLNIKSGGQHGITEDDIVYYSCKNERDLIQQFLAYWSTNTPNIYTGWNTEGFDTPYIFNRICQVLGEDAAKLLSPWGIVSKRQVEDDYKNMKDKVNILGINQLDYLELYKKYTYKAQESYKLDHIAHVELGDGKLSYDEAGSLRKLFRMDYQKYVEYNAIDILCVDRVEKKKKFFDVVNTIAYYAGINLDDTMSPVKTWDIIITNYLMKQKIVVPAMKIADKPRKYAGAFVKDPILGKKGWGASIDLDSLYPHLIMQWNIGPETFIPREKLPSKIQQAISNIRTYEFDEEGDPVVLGANGRDEYIKRFARNEVDLSAFDGTEIGIAGNLACFTNNKTSFLSELMFSNYAGRKFDKRQMLRYEQEAVWVEQAINDSTTVISDELMNDNRPESLKLESEFFYDSTLSTDELIARLPKIKNEIARLDCMQMARKILLNSCYGAIGNRYFRYFNIEMAEAITISGQVAIQYIAHKMNNEVNKIVGNPVYDNGTYHKDYISAIDTDSNYVDMDDIVLKYKPVEHAAALEGCPDAKNTIVDYVDKVFDKHLQGFMDDSYKDLQGYMNAKEQKMNMSREMIYQGGFWTAKKRYILKCWDAEGVRFDKPYWKIMGQEAIKSTTPEIVRGWLKSIYKTIVDGNEQDFQKEISGYKDEWETLPVHEIAKNSSCNGINKNYHPDTVFIEGASWQSRCGLLYNDLVKRMGLEREVDSIIDGDKVKLIELKTPNPVHYNKIAFPVFLAEELNLDKYIDRKTAFEKNVLSPLSTFMEILKWDSEERCTLDDFM